MGSSLLQSLLIARILRKLMGLLPEERYEFITNEAGLQFHKNQWCSVDIGIYTHQALVNRRSEFDDALQWNELNLIMFSYVPPYLVEKVFEDA